MPQSLHSLNGQSMCKSKNIGMKRLAFFLNEVKVNRSRPMKNEGIFFANLSCMMALVFFTSCSTDSEKVVKEEVTIVDSKTFVLGEVGDSGISGTATFISNSDNTLGVALNLNNTDSGEMHPAHIHFNTAAEGGGVALTLGVVNGDTGESTVSFTALDDGSAITYAELIDFDGYINVHLGANTMETLIAQADVGQNELTGISTEYALDNTIGYDIEGTATFYERSNGEALAVLQLINTVEETEHPAHIHSGNAADGGDIIFTFQAVDGDTGISKTNMAALDDETDFGYSDVLAFDGHINVHLSTSDMATWVSRANIGSNEGMPVPLGGISYTVTNQGSNAYVFDGNGLTDSLNPDITLERGKTYAFDVQTPGHPFFIKSVQGIGDGDTYDLGVANNGQTFGVVTFTVPLDAPDTLYYICELHVSMTGELNIID